MRQVLYSALMALLLTPSVNQSWAQTAGETKLGVTTIELAEIVKGWSVRRQLLSETVYNDKNEKIGNIEDIIITPERSISYAIVGSGGFLGIGSHDVAIPASQIRLINDRLVLPGATKEKVRAMPAFEYAPR